jgi:hypothetical protein
MVGRFVCTKFQRTIRPPVDRHFEKQPENIFAVWRSEENTEMSATNWVEAAEAAALKVNEIEAEIAGLEKRRANFEGEADEARVAASAAVSAIAQAKFAGGNERLESAGRKEHAEKERLAKESEAAANVAESHIAKARVRVEAQEFAYRATRLCGVSKSLKWVQEEIQPRALELLASVLRLDGSVSGEILNVLANCTDLEHAKTRLEVICAKWTAELARADAPPTPVPNLTEPICDTAFVAFLPIEYRTPDPRFSSRELPSGWIGLVPSALAKRAQAANGGQILPLPKKLEITIVSGGASFTVAQGDGSIELRHCPGGTITLDRRLHCDLSKKAKQAVPWRCRRRIRSPMPMPIQIGGGVAMS